MFGQTFDPQDIAVIGLLVVLEGILSIDNALVLGLLARRLPKKQQGRALTYGLIGAFAFRLLAVATAAFLLKWRFVKLLGGLYLVYVAVTHLFFAPKPTKHERLVVGPEGEVIPVEEQSGRPVEPGKTTAGLAAGTPAPVSELEHAGSLYPRFWPTVAVIEMTDIAFAIDSILAAIALVGGPPQGHSGPHPKLWLVVTGGMLGVVLMRFAAVLFIKMLERFPRFETSAYLLVIVIGGKLIADWAWNTPEHPHRLDFHDLENWAFWVFWTLMLICFSIGFIPPTSRLRAKR